MELETQKLLAPDLGRPKHSVTLIWILDIAVGPVVACVAWWIIHFDKKSLSAVLIDWAIILVVFIPSQYVVKRLALAAKHFYKNRRHGGTSLPH